MYAADHHSSEGKATEEKGLPTELKLWIYAQTQEFTHTTGHDSVMCQDVQG